MYIHNIYTGASGTELFGAAKLEQQRRFQQSRHGALIAQKKKQLRNLFKTQQEYEQFLSTFDNAIQNLQLPEHLTTAAINQALTQKSQSSTVTNLQQQIDKMRALITEYEEGMKKVILNKRNIYTAKQIEDYQKQLQFLKAQKEKLVTWEKTGVGELLTSMTREAGYLSEALIAEAISDVLAPIGGTAMVTGAQKGFSNIKGMKRGYKFKTSDIEIMMNNGRGMMTVALPGISIKRTQIRQNHQGQSYYDIKIKSSNFRQIMQTSQLDINGFDLESFYNIYANANRVAYVLKNNDQGKGEILPIHTHGDLDLSVMLNTLEKSMFLGSIAGNLTLTDNVEYFIVNNDVYHISDMIDEIVSNASNTKYSLSGISDRMLKNQASIAAAHTKLFIDSLRGRGDTQAKAKKRSEAIISRIGRLSIQGHLQIKL